MRAATMAAFAALSSSCSAAFVMVVGVVRCRSTIGPCLAPLVQAQVGCVGGGGTNVEAAADPARPVRSAPADTAAMIELRRLVGRVVNMRVAFLGASDLTTGTV